MQIKVKTEHHSNRFSGFSKNPMRVIVVSFALIIFIGTLLLMLPISTRSGQVMPLSEALFTATSATCVTGLVVEDTYTYFTTFGQVVILLLIQMGGLGLVTITTFFNLLIGRKLGLKNMHLAQESINSEGSQNITKLLKLVMVMTFCFESFGALVLSCVLVPEFGVRGIFIAVFLAISSFCNAGFDVLGQVEPFSNLSHYYDNPIVLLTIIFLIISGGLGFIVWHDLQNYRHTRRLMLHTKIVLLVTGVLVVCGTIVVALLEWNNARTLGTMNVGEKLLNSLFLSVSSRTAGFNTFDLGGMHDITKLFIVMMMFVGAAPGSTAGGIKITTTVVVLMTVFCVLRGREDTIIMGRRVDKSVVYKAMTISVIALAASLIATCVISMTVHTGGRMITGIDALFEAVSSFSTVGLTAGVTGVANLASRMVLVATMFMGRVGPVSIALSLSMRQGQNKHQVIPEGKIIVG